MIIRATLPETWLQKFCKFLLNVEYVFEYTTEEELNRAKRAVEKANKQKHMHFQMFIAGHKFSIIKVRNDG